MGRVRRSWTSEEDALLRKAVKTESRPLMWRELAKAVPGRSNKDCRRRWWNSLADCTSKGPWAEDEDERLIEAVRQYGSNWAQVARCVRSRNSDQCSSHWTSVLDPGINFADWTDVEDADLLHAVLTHGTNWATIAAFHNPKRTTLALKNRYSTLRLRHSNTRGKASSEGASSSATTPSQASRNPPASTAADRRDADHSYPLKTEWNSSGGGDDEDEEDDTESAEEYHMSTAGHDVGFYAVQDANLTNADDSAVQLSHPFNEPNDFIFSANLQHLTDPRLSEWNNASGSEPVDHPSRSSTEALMQDRPDEVYHKHTTDEPYLHLTPSSAFGFMDNPPTVPITSELSPPISTPDKTSSTLAVSGTAVDSSLPADAGPKYHVSINMVCSGDQLQSVVNMAGFGTDLVLKISPKMDPL